MLNPNQKQTRATTTAHVPTSLVLQELLDGVPDGSFTLDWLIVRLPQRSFGIIGLFLALFAMAPVGSTVPGLLLAILSLQIIANRDGPAFPYRIAVHSIPTRHLVRIGRYAIPILRYLERTIRPRWPATFGATRRVIGVVMLLLTAIVMLAPLPLANIPPALVIALIALAYIEQDGMLLSIALFAATILLTISSVAVWAAIVSTA